VARASPEQVAGWLAEALETGNPLAPLPAGAEPAGVAEGAHVAALVLEALGLVPCGLRLALGPDGAALAGPVLEGRLMPDGAAVALATVRHAAVAPGVMGVLAEDLSPEAEGAPPTFSALHPILDVSAWRLRDPPDSPALAAADLSGHGFIVAGRGKRGAAPGPLPVGLAPAGVRRRPETRDAAAALLAAANAARRAGGLPRGAVLAAVLGPRVAPPAEGQEIVAGLGALGRVRATFR
jgi:2-keto-4-pentenoate hydratase